MQDLSTGELVKLDSKVFEAFAASVPTMDFNGTEFQSAKDEAIPTREHQGPVFSIGEIIEIKGGKFRVNGMSRKRLYLDSIASL